MNIPERLSMLTPRKSNDYGAEPSKEQQRKIDEVHSILERSRKERRRQLLDRKHEAQLRGERFDVDPQQHPPARSTRVVRYTALGEELLASMHGCDPLGTAMVLIKHTQDRSSNDRAFDELYKKAQLLYVERNWQTAEDDKGKEILKSMCRLAIVEATDPLCGKCQGRGFGKRGGACRKCGATGKMRISDTDRAYAVGVTPDAFRKTHAGRYLWVKSIVIGYEHETLDQMYENLYGRKPWE